MTIIAAASESLMYLPMPDQIFGVKCESYPSDVSPLFRDMTSYEFKANQKLNSSMNSGKIRNEERTVPSLNRALLV
jgi:hypothetical protein